MKDDELRQDIIDELDFEPSIDAASIGVAVDDGIVTLSGHVASYAEKVAAEHAAQRVRGVRGIAQEIEVRFPDAKKTADDQIAKRAVDILAWNTAIPDGAVLVKVQKGWVTLSGTVDWQFQRISAADAVRRLSGVAGVSNLIEVKPQLHSANVKSSIENALKRGAEFEAHGIRVQVEGGKVTLDGVVHSWHERSAAERAAWSVAGVTSVKDNLAIG
ncbi:BON domain-containing protein [Pollutimonas bauzanensis]|uniref:Osmotically-inducible protein OsmY, contains BON domain n=1 Tax=Pollutimonas bauzanensis TaxID=658167 RepID=A0A1M5MP65_9BURK|nr:BON domain-containing protein [Pollutimonas bauzanensis]SHG79035.1 Osmotically-inducible protein OsmY, contains BON domain [Pollutimonas bauzanensis]